MTPQKIHFVGIGGIGMSGLAAILLTLNYRVSGSDLARSELTRSLAARGARIYLGHKAQNIQGADVVVVSSAIAKNNPEIKQAAKLKIPVITRGELLADLMRMKYGIAVAGSHGKTTSSSLIGAILTEGGLDPTLIVGGRVKNLGSNARLGQGPYLVAETDESDGSFLKLNPTIAVVTNIDREHMDHYQHFGAVKESFEAFCNKIPFYGLAILGIDHPVVRELARKIQKRSLTFGLCPDAQLRATDLKQRGRMASALIHYQGRRTQTLGTIHLKLSGEHNIKNALAAIAVGLELCLPFKTMQKALAGFQGIARRLELIGQSARYTLLDDYGHHPEEIQATLKAVKQSYTGPLTVVFQPHRYTRTQDLFKDFLKSFTLADNLIVTDIYPASEKRIPGISSQKLVASMRHPCVRFESDFSKIKTILRNRLNLSREHEVLITLGAGDVWKVGRDLASLLPKTTRMET